MKHPIIILFLMLITCIGFSQDTTSSTTAPAEKDKRPVKSPFESGIMINSQTVEIPTAKTLEFEISHRFGTMESGISDLYGIFGSANSRLALNFSILKTLQVGFGTTRFDKLQDFNMKWNILSQTRSGNIPLFVSYYTDMAINAGPKDDFDKFVHRLSFFHEIILARKINEMFSVQVSSSISHINFADTTTFKGLSNDNIGVSASGRVKFTPQTSLIFEYIHPLTTRDGGNPKPDIGIGVEIATSAHAFQIFLSSYGGLNSQKDVVFNTNDFTKIGDGKKGPKGIMIGFNITRLWNL
ncbi:MAG: hypothetical protein HYY40_10830 [Bacteroidetes bacterium]|nr:hypothetical protein [Bacteroidota bacterium]